MDKYHLSRKEHKGFKMVRAKNAEKRKGLEMVRAKNAEDLRWFAQRRKVRKECRGCPKSQKHLPQRSLSNYAKIAKVINTVLYLCNICDNLAHFVVNKDFLDILGLMQRIQQTKNIHRHLKEKYLV